MLTSPIRMKLIPMTMRGNLQFSKQKGFGKFEDDFNDMSMIKDSTNVETY